MSGSGIPAELLRLTTDTLLANRHANTTYWGWLSDSCAKRLSKKSANKFFLACILDYQIPAEQAWENARRLAEDIFNDPNELWRVIADYSEEEWQSKWQTYKLHRFPAAHKRVWRIGRAIVNDYAGDARKIWEGQHVGEVRGRLDKLGVGEQIGRMIIGALIDTGHIRGIGDVKADIHVRRVLGRILVGQMLSAEDAVDFARTMCPSNPWLLDNPLYWIGKQVCSARDPNCQACYLSDICVFYEDQKSQSKG